MGSPHPPSGDPSGGPSGDLVEPITLSVFGGSPLLPDHMARCPSNWHFALEPRGIQSVWTSCGPLWCFVVVQMGQNTLYSPTEPRLSHFFPSVGAGFSGSVVKSGSVLSFRYTQLCSIDAGCRAFSTHLLGCMILTFGTFPSVDEGFRRVDKTIFHPMLWGWDCHRTIASSTKRNTHTT